MINDKASQAYRRGYYHGFAGVPKADDNKPGTFAAHDYDDGYKAGINDAKPRAYAKHT
jgi:ribosome modulation factor